MLEMEIRNLGARRIVTMIQNGFAGFGGGKQYSERKIWPMDLDKTKQIIAPPSEKLVKEEIDFIKHFWPDANYRDYGEDS